MDDNAPASPTAPGAYYEGFNPKVFELIPETCLRILEVGCATGVLGAAIKRRNPKVHYVGVEKFAAAGEAARARLDQVYLADAEHFEWPILDGGRFDCVVFADVLEHLRDPERVFRAATASLVPGGCVVCCVPNVAHWSILTALARGRWDYADSGLLDRTHIRFFTPATFAEFLERCGFLTVSETPWKSPPSEFDGIIPWLQYLKIDPATFARNAFTVQIVVKAQRISASSSPRLPAGRGWRLPSSPAP